MDILLHSTHAGLFRHRVSQSKPTPLERWLHYIWLIFPAATAQTLAQLSLAHIPHPARTQLAVSRRSDHSSLGQIAPQTFLATFPNVGPKEELVVLLRWLATKGI